MKAPALSQQNIPTHLTNTSDPRMELTKRHDQTRIRRQLHNLLDIISHRCIFRDEEGQDRPSTSDQDQREDRVPAASDDNAQLAPLAHVQRVVRIGRRHRYTTYVAIFVEKVDIGGFWGFEPLAWDDFVTLDRDLFVFKRRHVDEFILRSQVRSFGFSPARAAAWL